ncbi:ATP-binding protein [Paracoccus tegillarcae]|uniref:histidine kinase n=1 Tax=Paracoccus tegillarcae TaxID=1529068 RepID=A0A2K9F2U2_9RHOB|nr:ATP-binding protein [Paracoccus tegillarcae]AUH34682.1 two-component sensor histidine kinase [Paracoccus tegillarcae]
MAFRPDFTWLKRFFPRGIYGRAALILFLPVVTVTLVVSVMFLQRHFDDVTRQMTASMARELAFVAAQVDQAANSPGAMLAGETVARPLGLSLMLPVPGPVEDSRLFYDFSGRVVIDALRQEVPQVTGIDLGSDIKRVNVTMDGAFGPYMLSFDRARVSASNPHQLLVLMMFTSLLMSGIATIFLRNQLRPIRRLARAAEEYGKGRIVPYRPAGATEVRSAGAAFLDMRNRIERSNEQRKIMLSGISHDLRTPLTRLRLGLSMLSPDDLPDQPEIDDMVADVDEMGRMISAFLDFARDEAQEGQAVSIAALPFLRGVVADAQRAGQNVSLIMAEGSDEAEVAFRPDMLRRAIENLFGNAVRYGTLAEVEVVLGPRSLRISVEDDGPGIPETQLDEAMRPFTRLDSSRNQNRGQGVGLGLAIAADVARAHGGQLRLGQGRKLDGLRAEIVIPR